LINENIPHPPRLATPLKDVMNLDSSFWEQWRLLAIAEDPHQTAKIRTTGKLLAELDRSEEEMILLQAEIIRLDTWLKWNRGELESAYNELSNYSDEDIHSLSVQVQQGKIKLLNERIIFLKMFEQSLGHTKLVFNDLNYQISNNSEEDEVDKAWVGENADEGIDMIPMTTLELECMNTEFDSDTDIE